ncbi:hypothetical protein H6P81_007029 [Aristolochia fimbriata]|uniref:Uncharacterized protein n=1 Tax=Aristolochia fimbriata TaxID=158543 RepID=A0AAV7EYZ8_ARIFI|nr:hypothetical protein H6P81_007029 [Aristolochia fimbriata]
MDRNRGNSFERGAACSEESGWTMYFEDFFLSEENNNNIRDQSSGCSSGLYGSSSLVSDAASCAAWEVSNHQNGDLGSMQKSCKKLSFKKKRSRVPRNDEDLEDTASSPANSPKVCDLKQFHDMNPRKGVVHVSETSQFQEEMGEEIMGEEIMGEEIMGEEIMGEEIMGEEMGEEMGYGKPPSELQMDGRSNLGFVHQEGNECTQLKKKGLCLVPISMLANYIR